MAKTQWFIGKLERLQEMATPNEQILPNWLGQACVHRQMGFWPSNRGSAGFWAFGIPIHSQGLSDPIAPAAFDACQSMKLSRKNATCSPSRPPIQNGFPQFLWIAHPQGFVYSVRVRGQLCRKYCPALPLSIPPQDPTSDSALAYPGLEVCYLRLNSVEEAAVAIPTSVEKKVLISNYTRGLFHNWVHFGKCAKD